MTKVYLETTIFNRCCEEGREYSEASRKLFDLIAAGNI